MLRVATLSAATCYLVILTAGPAVLALYSVCCAVLCCAVLRASSVRYLITVYSLQSTGSRGVKYRIRSIISFSLRTSPRATASCVPTQLSTNNFPGSSYLFLEDYVPAVSPEGRTGGSIWDECLSDICKNTPEDIWFEFLEYNVQESLTRKFGLASSGTPASINDIHRHSQCNWYSEWAEVQLPHELWFGVQSEAFETWNGYSRPQTGWSSSFVHQKR